MGKDRATKCLHHPKQDSLHRSFSMQFRKTGEHNNSDEMVMQATMKKDCSGCEHPPLALVHKSVLYVCVSIAISFSFSFVLNHLFLSCSAS